MARHEDKTSAPRRDVSSDELRGIRNTHTNTKETTEERQGVSSRFIRNQSIERKSLGRKIAGNGAQATGSAMQVGGAGLQVAGKSADMLGTGAMRAGAALSTTGIGAIAGVPLAAVGGVVKTAGVATNATGKAVRRTGKSVNRAGKVTKKASSIRKLSSFTRFASLGIAFIICFWQFFFALVSLIGFGFHGTTLYVKEQSVAVTIVDSVLNISKLIPGEYLGVGFWGLASLLSLAAFTVYFIWFYATGLRPFSTVLSALVTIVCISLSLIPITNLFPWLVFWIIYTNGAAIFIRK